MRIVSLARICSSYLDLLAGSEEERELIIRLLQEIDNPLLTYQLHPTTVIHFRDRGCTIDTNCEVFPAFAMPYTTKCTTEGKLVGSIDKLNEGDILITEIPEDIDDAKFVLINALKKGSAGVIFYDKLNSPRRIVVSIEENYTYSTGKFIEIPVLSIPSSIGRRLLRYVGSNIKIDCDVDYRESIGYNVEIILSENDSKNLLVTAHFDHWFYGFLDNSLGTGLVLTLIEDLMRLSENVGIRIVLFTAEEFGIPNLASLYWAWGSKSYLEYIRSTDIFNTIKFILNIDVIGRKVCTYTTKDIHESLNIPISFEQSIPYFDTLNFEPTGIPCMTFSCLKDCWNIYHTLLENIYNISLEDIADTYNILLHTIKKLVDNNLEIDYRKYITKCKFYLEKNGIFIQNIEYSYETYRTLRSILSKNLVIKTEKGYELQFSENILETLDNLIARNYVIEVSELGTGNVLIRSPCSLSYRLFVNYFRDLVRYYIRR